jgi:Protein of unknown function (DUF2975)
MKKLPRIMLQALNVGSWVFLIGAIAFAALTVTLSLVNPFAPGSPQPATARMSFATPIAFYPSTVATVKSATFGEGQVNSESGELAFQMHPRTSMWFVLFGQAIFVVPLWLFMRLILQVLTSIERGEPFTDDIAKHVRWLGVGVIGYYGARALLGVAVWAWLQHDLTGNGIQLYPGGVEPIGLLVGFAILVLAGVFTYGARLRTDAELTV